MNNHSKADSRPPRLDYASKPRFVGNTTKRWTIICFILFGTVVGARFASRQLRGQPSAFDQLMSQRGHGTLYDFVGPKTVFVQDAAFETVVASPDPALTDRLVKALNSGEIDEGQQAVIDLALWRRATGLNNTRIAVLGSYQRPSSTTDYSKVAASWAAWRHAGRPMNQRGDMSLPDLRGYPNFELVIK